MPIKKGDFVIVSVGVKYRWLFRVEPGVVFHNNFGMVHHDGLIGLEFGDLYTSPQTNKKFVILKPLMYELVTNFARRTQIIYPKDVGYIVMRAGVQPGMRVLEAGTGSGAMSILLGNIVGGSFDGAAPGKVVSYEVVEKHHHAAHINIAKAGMAGVVDARLGNILERDVQEILLNEDKFDSCVFDMPNPWDLVDFAWKVLKPTGVFCSFLPVIEQVIRIAGVLKEGNWFDVDVVDLAVRRWQARKNATRPKNHGNHTGFLVFARKINEKPPLDWTRKNRKDLIRKLEKNGEIRELEDGDLDFLNGTSME
ncbi:MAG: tRNA (adenine-N1)-methyltransferase [Promethearchaeota archaeon]